jgi:hypothetical protein
VKLPDGGRADVPLSRLTGYLLNPEHDEGKHKARVFAAALGLHAPGADEFRTWLLGVAREGEAELGRSDKHGQRFVIRAKFLYKGREAMVRTAWIIRSGRDFPEFLTALVE